MNEEYLWQRSGSDPEIELLEKKLAVLRHRDAPLRFPVAEPVTDAAAVPWWRIAWGFALATPVLAAVLIAALFIGINNDSPESDVVFVENPELEISSPQPPATTEEPKFVPAAAPKVVPQFVRNNRHVKPRTEPILDRRPKEKSIDPNTHVAALTDEEKFAYRQLMLALSISSSKLKMVQDSINGNENPESGTSTNQR